MSDMTISQEAVEFELVITHNVLSGAFSVSGHSKNHLVALGMLEYAKQLVNRENMKQVVLDEMKNAPLVIPGKRSPV
jgi:hypothetical protein